MVGVCAPTIFYLLGCKKETVEKMFKAFLLLLL